VRTRAAAGTFITPLSIQPHHLRSGFSGSFAACASRARRTSWWRARTIVPLPASSDGNLPEQLDNNIRVLCGATPLASSYLHILTMPTHLRALFAGTAISRTLLPLHTYASHLLRAMHTTTFPPGFHLCTALLPFPPKKKKNTGGALHCGCISAANDIIVLVHPKRARDALICWRQRSLRCGRKRKHLVTSKKEGCASRAHSSTSLPRALASFFLPSTTLRLTLSNYLSRSYYHGADFSRTGSSSRTCALTHRPLFL